MLEGIVVVIFLVGILWLMVKDVVSFRSTGSFPRAEGKVSRIGGLVLGLVTVAALAGLVERGSLGIDSIVAVAMGIGALSALIGRFPELGTIGAWGMSIIGLIATVPAIASLATGRTACGTSTPALGVFASGALLVILYVMAAVASAFAGRGVSPGVGVALFGGVEVLAFMNSPLGIDLIGNAPLAYIAAMVGAILLGFAVVRTAEVVLGLSAFVILFASFGGGHYCGPGLDYVAGFGTFVSFAVAYVILSMVFGSASRRR